jgi:hypothetical protein
MNICCTRDLQVLTSALCRFSADYCAEFINAITLIENMEVTQRGMAIPFNHSQDRLFFVQVRPHPSNKWQLFIYFILNYIC